MQAGSMLFHGSNSKWLRLTLVPQSAVLAHESHRAGVSQSGHGD